MDIVVELGSRTADWLKPEVIVAAIALLLAFLQPQMLLARQQLRDEVGARNLAWIVGRIVIDYANFKAGKIGRDISPEERDSCDRALAAIPLDRVTEIAEPIVAIDFMWSRAKIGRWDGEAEKVALRVEYAMYDLDEHLLNKGVIIQASENRLALVPGDLMLRRAWRTVFRAKPAFPASPEKARKWSNTTIASSATLSQEGAPADETAL